MWHRGRHRKALTVQALTAATLAHTKFQDIQDGCTTHTNAGQAQAVQTDAAHHLSCPAQQHSKTRASCVQGTWLPVLVQVLPAAV